MASDGQSLSIAIASVGALTLDQALQPMDGAGVALGASLERLVDAVELRTEPEPTIILVKSLPTAVR